MSLNTIPVVDLQQFIHGDNEAKQAFVEALGRAFEETGFVSVKNHGVPQEVIDQFYQLSRAVF
jgi:isopenicillin N synthase-like dioxygenase